QAQGFGSQPQLPIVRIVRNSSQERAVLSSPPTLVSLCLLGISTLVAGCGEAPGLVLNEFVASNSTGAADETGAFPDWIELHNTSDQTVSLHGWFLSDDLDNPTRHALPSDTSIDAGDFLIFYADGDVEDGGQHLGFRLSAAGEDLVLTYSDRSQFTVVDSISYEAQATDTAQARIPDGTGDWQLTTTPTPGSGNEATDGS
ncbi:MAG TPA: hypothetical protein DIU15_06735, partial [Deltaproteobacteria bacterium]|nr:hypothetical protein [Deltaproteobacteria bacterium]